jgi:hypothetical protein
MAAYTSSTSGNWSNNATWGGGGHPGNGDTATIASGHTVTVDVNTTVGTSGVNGSNAVTMGGLTSQIFVNGGVIFTIRGDFQIKAGFSSSISQLFLNAGSTLQFDSSAAASPFTTKYCVKPDAGFSWGFFEAVGTALSRCTVISNPGGGNGYFSANTFTQGGSIVASYTDFIRIGDAGNPGFNPLFSNNGPVQWLAEFCTFNACGVIDGTALAFADTSIIHTNNVHLNTPGNYNLLMSVAAALTTGTRNFNNNVFDAIFGSDGSGVMVPKDCTINNNYFARPPQFGGTTTQTWASFDGNLLLTPDNVSPFVTLVVEGDTTNNYFIASSYDQLHVHTPDIGSGPVTINISHNIFDSLHTSSDPINSNDGIVEAKASDTLTTLTAKYNITLPTGDGIYGCQALIDSYGILHTSYDLQHNTLCCPASRACIMMEYEDFNLPNGVAGRGDLKNNIFYGITNPPSNGNAFAMNACIENPITDFMAPGNILNNNRYRLLMTNPATPHNPPNQGNSYIGAWSVTPGSSDLQVNPQFKAPSRNALLFYTNYLGIVPSIIWSAQATSHTFAVGDIVSDHNSGFFGNATIAYRCIVSHIKSTANSEPGVGSAWLTYWEPATYFQIRTAIAGNLTITDAALGLSGVTYIQALTAWVRDGFAPLNLALQFSATDGTQIGAIPVFIPPPTYTISGTISQAADGQGSTVNLTGGQIESTTADSFGDYSFPGLVSSSYIVTPTKTGYTFTPTSHSVTLSGADVPNINFLAQSGSPPPVSFLSTEIYIRRKLGGDFGTPIGESGLHYKQDFFTGNGSATAFTLSNPPSVFYPTLVYLNGVMQTSGYSVSGTTLGFTIAPMGTIVVVYEY